MDSGPQSLLAWGNTQTPFRKAFDYSRTPYDARNALGLGTTVADILTLQKYLITTPVTVANLPAPGTAGRRAFVTNSNATMTAGIGAIVAGGGGSVVPVFDDGTNWRIG